MGWTAFVPMESSNVKGARYNADERILEIVFKNNAVYHYYDVEEHIWEAFLKAPSKGKFVWTEIRDVFDYKKMK